MIEVRPFDSLGGANHGWLDAKHHFSFADYHDPARVHWGNLRVWNDDVIAAKSGFPPHPHANMEIITWPGEAIHPEASAHGLLRRHGEAAVYPERRTCAVEGLLAMTGYE